MKLNLCFVLQFLTKNTDFTIIGVIGPPGVGKSTTLNELCRFDGRSPKSLGGINTLPDCYDRCGGLDIPYPFGITDGCFKEGFRLRCTNISSVLKLYLESDTQHNMPITNISLPTGEVHIIHPILYDCYGQARRTASPPFSVNISGTVYTFSHTRNWFTAVGCDTQGYINGTVNNTGSMTPFTVGCISTCYQSESVVNGVCSGIGCCQARIPKGIKYFEVGFNSYYNHTRVMNFNPCSYVFLVQQDWYKFTPNDISDGFYSEYSGGVPAVLNFSIGTESCSDARRYKSEYACVSRNSDCSDVGSGSGYICSCSPGYEGNPYLKNGCEDIDECKKLGEYPCPGNICINTPGSYKCICPPGTNGSNPMEYPCLPVPPRSRFPVVADIVSD
ncbi:Wall-associated receptor kinase 2 [Acorus calamus]|uniref:Wall-associated receptor kinase 2 n=1 Tax=Acorus calamus TaxID=4465 RepID=A0AAV9CF93_ACOCL|nr:Wall-associated receptor kinase 2 [Acorus calamus]